MQEAAAIVWRRNRIWSKWRPYGAGEMFSSFSQHKMMLPNLIGEEWGLALWWNTPCLAARPEGALGHRCVSMETRAALKLRGWDVYAEFCLLCFCVVLPPETDTLIIVLSETKMGNRSHNNRCVGFHGRDPLSWHWSETPGWIQVSQDNDSERKRSELL